MQHFSLPILVDPQSFNPSKMELVSELEGVRIDFKYKMASISGGTDEKPRGSFL